jgi:carbamoyl-phosphate synthase large subunit
MARAATEVMLGRKLADLKLKKAMIPHVGVKEPVFPFVMFPEVDPQLGPEMRSTGEVMGIAPSFGLAFDKAFKGAKHYLPDKGTVLISVCRRDRTETVVETARRFKELGFTVKATKGTHAFLKEHGVDTEPIFKLYEGRPSILDAIKNKQLDLIINTPAGKLAVTNDAYIRKEAIRQRIPCIHTVAAARAAAEGIAARRAGGDEVKSLQEYHAAIK